MKLKSILIALTALVLFACNEEVEIIGNWVKKSSFDGYSRGNAISFTINNVGYYGLGYDGEDYYDDLWSFTIGDGELGTWSELADFPGAGRTGAIALATTSKGYVGFGYDGDDYLKDFWEYNPATNSWKELAAFPDTSRYGAVGFTINDELYVGTGYFGKYDKKFYKYSPSSDSWTSIASFGGEKLRDAIGFSYKGKGYVLGGYINGWYEGFYSYNPATDQWSALNRLSEDNEASGVARSNGCAIVSEAEGKVWIACGNNNNSALRSVWEWNPTDDTWTEKTSFEGSGREGAGTFFLNGKGFIVGGSSGSQYYDDIWMFEPTKDKDTEDNF